jgi:hypothetical protein
MDDAGSVMVVVIYLQEKTQNLRQGTERNKCCNIF